MSLKHFHIAFIAVTVVFFGGLAAWCLLVDGLPRMIEVMGWISLVCGAVMLVYGVRFLRKIKHLVH